MKYVDPIACARENAALFPVAAYPRGMAAFTLETAAAGSERFYNYGGELKGLRLTHCVTYDGGDFCALTFMPQSGGGERKAKPKNLKFRPYEISGETDEVRFRLVPGVHGCFLRLEYTAPDRAHRLYIRGAELSLESGGRTVGGTCGSGRDDMIYPLKMFVNMLFDTDFTLTCGGGETVLEFDGDVVEMKLATSFISHENALAIRRREYDVRDIERARLDCLGVWEHYFSRVTAIAATERQQARLKDFYTCLYRVFLNPRRFYEASPEHEPIHIDLNSGEVKSGVQYYGCDVGGSARTVLPLLSVIAPEVYGDVIVGLNESTKDLNRPLQGMLPFDGRYSTGMPIELIFSDAVVKKAAVAKQAIELLHAVKESVVNSRKVSLYGRACAQFYLRNGFLPCEEVRDSVAETLEYCYADYAFTRAAMSVGHLSVYDMCEGNDKNYLRLMDESGEFRPRNKNGEFVRGQSACGDVSVMFDVCHDMSGLIERRPDLTERLKKVLGVETDRSGKVVRVDTKNIFLGSTTLHLPYIFAEIGDAKTTSDILEAAADSLSGGALPETGNGEAAAWYVLACIGLYPFCIGRGDYLVTRPLFDSVRISVEGTAVTFKDGKNRPLRITHGSLRRVERV